MLLQDVDIPDISCIINNEIISHRGDTSDKQMHIQVVIWILSNVQRNNINKEMEKVGLTASQLQVFLYLLNHHGEEEEINSRTLEQIFRVSNPTMAGILKRLESKGFIERYPSKKDGRNKQIKAVGNVAALRREIDAHIELEKKKVYRGFSEEEISLLDNMLTRILYNMENNK